MSMLSDEISKSKGHGVNMIFSGFSGNAVPVIPRTVNAETFAEEAL